MAKKAKKKASTSSTRGKKSQEKKKKGAMQRYIRPPLERVAHRMVTHKPNGSLSVEVAPERDRKPIILPEPEDAVLVLKGLAELNDQATDAHERYLDLKERAKLAKEKWEGLAEEVQRKLRQATHGSDLPLFDAVERETDHQEMLKAVDTAGSAGEDGSGSTNGEAGNGLTSCC